MSLDADAVFPPKPFLSLIVNRLLKYLKRNSFASNDGESQALVRSLSSAAPHHQALRLLQQQREQVLALCPTRGEQRLMSFLPGRGLIAICIFTSQTFSVDTV